MSCYEKSYRKQWDFYTNFLNKIFPKLKKFEKERKLRLFLNWFLITAFILTSLFALYFVYSIKLQFELAALFWVHFLVLLSILIEVNKKYFENKIKKEIMPLLCSFYEDLRWYKGKDCKQLKSFDKNCLLPEYSRKKYDDIFSGTYKDVCFTIAEARYSRRAKDHESPYFRGIIVKLEMNKNFTGHTVIMPATCLHTLPAKHLKHTILEDVCFEEKFDVFCNDEIEARYLITPAFMERLASLKLELFANEIRCAFYKNNLFIALSTPKDLFSLCSLIRPVDDFVQYETMHNEIVSILKLIEYFKLNENIGL